MSSRKQCSNEQPDCEWWERTFFGPTGSPHHYMCTLPDERYRAECPIIQKRVTQEKLEDMVKDKCCEKCDAYEPFCRDGCPVFIDEYENQCRRDEREKLLDELLVQLYPLGRNTMMACEVYRVIAEFRSSNRGDKQE